MVESPYFTAALFSFLNDLSAHNTREWFKENRDRYDRDLKEPAQRFILAMGERLPELSAYLRADPRPVGGSLFRVHRDLRFSNDKSPYKTHAGIHFRHSAAKDAHAPGVYLHLEPSGSFLGLGIWRPASAPLRAIREALVEAPDRWRDAVAELGAGGLELSGDSLTRMPRGFDTEHPLARDLRRKDLIAVAPLTRAEVVTAGLPEALMHRAVAGRPLFQFICDALGVAR
jgi:uncharacterized protein (TIGR02453 family)